MGAIIAALVETGETQDGRGRRRNSAERKEELLRAFRESLNRESLANVLEAQCVARTFRDDYNSSRPHSLIQQRMPADYRAELLAKLPTPVRPAKPGLPPSAACHCPQLHPLPREQPTTRPVSHRRWSKVVSPVSRHGRS